MISWLKKVVRIVLHGPAISQSDPVKSGPYKPPFRPGNIATLLPTAFYDFLSYGDGIFIPHSRKQCYDYLIDLKFGTHN